MAYYYRNVLNAISYDSNGSKLVFSLEHKRVNPKSKYIIKYIVGKDKKGNKKTKEYSLELRKIGLRIYSFGVGILSFEVDNYKYSDLRDINKINNFGRAVYPQFISANLVGENADKKDILSVVKNQYLADSLEIRFNNGKDESIKEDFDSYFMEEGKFISPTRIHTSKTVIELIDKIFTEEKEDCEKEKYIISPIIDERMFVISTYFNRNTQKYNNISKYYPFDKIHDYYTIEEEEKEAIEMWHNYLFIDSWMTCQSDKMTRRILRECTYERWQNFGTMYGMTSFSFVALLDCTKPNFFADNILSVHMRTIYQDMIMLVLIQKACMQRFEEGISNIFNGKEDKDDIKKVEMIEREYASYLKFMKTIYFREVTPQTQGIEMYEMFQKRLRVAENVEELRNDIVELQNYGRLIYEKKANEKAEELSKRNQETDKKINLITILGLPIAITSLITGYMGMNISGAAELSVIKPLPVFALLILLIGTTIAVIEFMKRNSNSIRFYITIFILLVVTFFIIATHDGINCSDFFNNLINKLSHLIT